LHGYRYLLATCTFRSRCRSSSQSSASLAGQGDFDYPLTRHTQTGLVQLGEARLRFVHTKNYDRGLNENGRYSLLLWVRGTGPPGAGQIFLAIMSARTSARCSNDL